MDLTRIDRLVAEKVMGWHTGFISDGRWIVKKEWWLSKDGLAQEIVYKWHPTTDISRAWMVVEKMEPEYHWTIRTPFDKGDRYSAGLTPLGFTGWNGIPDYLVNADTAPLAICLAALKAKGIEIN